MKLKIEQHIDLMKGVIQTTAYLGNGMKLTLTWKTEKIS